MTFDYLVQQLINGISIGSIYALIALGYTMVYGIIKLINFAHGDVFFVGAYTGYFAAKAGLGLILSLILAMVVCGILGVLIERLAYKPLRNAARIVILITAIGVSFLLENLGIITLGAQAQGFPEIVTKSTYTLWGDVTIDSIQIIVLAVTVILMAVLQFVVHRTKIGKAMRAVSFDMEAARLMGINVDSTISATFAIGSALAGAAGVVFAVMYPSVDPLMGIIPGLKAFVAAVLGGIGIIPGALVGGLLLGVVETGVQSIPGMSLWRDGVAFGILILILIFKPTGLFGKNVREKV
ncbi:branched-chain amino acid ABC transporter permease [Tumebacillus sp. ITR2]|uniref:Branched-chain amino acid ABC transporter permease n=1 Tax=Tumebacillus amylolyticus TaxID=2801339 RepID=A0ABS1J8X6_9BACL|nr:branched-chain amino acid ABC transporter permease [Tumebacillus amylolyticus]MBL0386630.1 branched-chain amino acid ABC transporter permease [Tumebacillus amylolyticus]